MSTETPTLSALAAKNLDENGGDNIIIEMNRLYAALEQRLAEAKQERDKFRNIVKESGALTPYRIEGRSETASQKWHGRLAHAFTNPHTRASVVRDLVKEEAANEALRAEIASLRAERVWNPPEQTPNPPSRRDVLIRYHGRTLIGWHDNVSHWHREDDDTELDPRYVRGWMNIPTFAPPQEEPTEETGAGRSLAQRKSENLSALEASRKAESDRWIEGMRRMGRARWIHDTPPEPTEEE